MDFLLGAEFSWLSPASWWALAQVIIGLGFVIFVHELGHFLVAKACGVKCEKFYVGFDFFDIKLGDRVIIPRSLVKWQWGETEYGVGILPLGGYVKMFGQVDSPAEMEREIQRSMLEEEDQENPPELPSGLVDRSKMDPRSFLAKSVPQRMAIMSAGVVFNLIFAVILAAIAFRSGVFYSPPTIGSTTPGGPAWQANLVNTTPVQVGDKKVEGYFQYSDLAQEIALNGGEQPLTIRYVRPGSDEVEEVEVTPRPNMIRRAPDLALIGVAPASTHSLGADPIIKFNPAAKADPGFESNDRIVEVNGDVIDSGFTLRQSLARRFDEKLAFVLERKVAEDSDETTRVTVEVETNPFRELGLVMKWGPIAAIQEASPAAQAGLQVGDVIVSIDDLSHGSFLTLDQRLTRIAREAGTVRVHIERDGNPQTIEVAPRLPIVIPTVNESHPVAIDTLGIALPIENQVESVLDSSPAAQAGIRPGDEITVFEYRLNDEFAKYPLFAPFVSNADTMFNQIRTSFGVEANDQARIKLNESAWTIAEMLSSVQILPAGTDYGITVKRGDEEQTFELTSQASPDYFLASRGIQLNMLQDFYRSEYVGESLQLGLKQTITDSSRIFKFLIKLVTGKISATNLGGPGTIALVATTEASEGTSRLLLFLTLLSANLAIVNFLPIPVLDGGHMVFLAYEGLFRKPVTPRVQEQLMILGLLFLIVLMVSVLILDAFRIASLF